MDPRAWYMPCSCWGPSLTASLIVHRPLGLLDKTGPLELCSQIRQQLGHSWHDLCCSPRARLSLEQPSSQRIAHREAASDQWAVRAVREGRRCGQAWPDCQQRMPWSALLTCRRSKVREKLVKLPNMLGGPSWTYLAITIICRLIEIYPQDT